MLKGLSPLNRLSGGYAYVTDGSGNPVKDPHKLREGETIDLRFKEGRIKAQVKEISE